MEKTRVIRPNQIWRSISACRKKEIKLFIDDQLIWQAVFLQPTENFVTQGLDWTTTQFRRKVSKGTTGLTPIRKYTLTHVHANTHAGASGYNA